MTALRPVPFGALVTRLFRELDRKQAAFDLPARRFYLGDAYRDMSIAVHGHRASSPFGPAAGPHTQMAQNIVLSWLAGGRIIELKTVQAKDDLEIPRPCIDMQTVGFNVEWSQELSLEQSLEEYVKAYMLIEMLKACGMAQGFGDTVFDMSVGYDLAGIRSAKVRSFMAGMLDASAVIDRLRGEIPDEWAELRDLPFSTCISDTLTLSTFHGCPPAEIEGIARFLLEEVGLHVVVKLNPTLLGEEELTDILHRRLGYGELVVPPAAFANDPTWEQVVGFVDRLGALAETVGRGFGVKFSNTLLVRNHKNFFPATEREMYLSGQPLHVLAMALVRRFRRQFGDRFPISFSAGIDAGNFADAVALGLKPVSVCTDLLKNGGYGRSHRYLADLAERMAAVGVADVDSFAIKAYGHAEPALDSLGLPANQSAACRVALKAGGDLRAVAGESFDAWVSAARLLNTETYVDQALADPRYGAAATGFPPKKIGRSLQLFDCLTCDKCVPVCPNDANFTFVIPPGDVPVESLTLTASGEWQSELRGHLTISKPRQFGTFADICNECGNCDVFCPEDGGPYLRKSQFFGSAAAWVAAGRDGFALENLGDSLLMYGRFGADEVSVESGKGLLRYRGDGFDIRLDLADPAGTAQGTASGPVDLTRLRIMELIRSAVMAPEAINYVGVLLAQTRKEDGFICA